MDRELRDLDDVDKALEEKPIEGVIERKRARRIANMRKRQKQEQLHEMLGLLGIPAVVVNAETPEKHVHCRADFLPRTLAKQTNRTL